MIPKIINNNKNEKKNASTKTDQPNLTKPKLTKKAKSFGYGFGKKFASVGRAVTVLPCGK